MEREKMLDKINTALNILDNVRAELINEGIAERKRSKTKTKAKAKEEKPPKTTDDFIRSLETERDQELTELRASYKILLTKYKLPTDEKFIDELIKAVERNGLNADRLTALLGRVSYANDLNPKRDIKEYIFKCINNDANYKRS